MTAPDAADDRWPFAEATVLRAAAMIQLLVMAAALLTPHQLLPAWGLPVEEPATFLRAWFVAYGALGLALVRAVRAGRTQGRLLVESVALVKVAFVSVVVVDVLARKLPNRAWIAVVLDLVFGIALYRAARRAALSPALPKS